MSEKMTLEENTEFTEIVLRPIIFAIDLAVETYDIERLRETYKAMQEKLGTMKALPFQESMDKAEATEPMNELYKGILDLIEIRIKQKEKALEMAARPNVQDVMSHFGL